MIYLHNEYPEHLLYHHFEADFGFVRTWWLYWDNKFISRDVYNKRYWDLHHDELICSHLGFKLHADEFAKKFHKVVSRGVFNGYFRSTSFISSDLKPPTPLCLEELYNAFGPKVDIVLF
jgi:hypothetical protein